MSKIISGVVFNALGPILKLSNKVVKFDILTSGRMEFLKIMVFMRNHEKIDFLEIDPQCHRNVPECLERFVKKF